MRGLALAALALLAACSREPDPVMVSGGQNGLEAAGSILATGAVPAEVAQPEPAFSDTPDAKGAAH